MAWHPHKRQTGNTELSEKLRKNEMRNGATHKKEGDRDTDWCMEEKEGRNGEKRTIVNRPVFQKN